MDWAKVKLTADDFERGSINILKGTTFDTQKDGDTWTSHWRTKNLIKIDKAINIPIKSGYKYYLCFYDDSGNYVNNYSFRSYALTIKKTTAPYMAIVIAKNDESPMEQTEIFNALPGYIWTAGQPEFGKLKDGSMAKFGGTINTPLLLTLTKVKAVTLPITPAYLRDVDADLYIRNIMVTYGDEDYPYTPAPEIDPTVVIT